VTMQTEEQLTEK